MTIEVVVTNTGSVELITQALQGPVGPQGPIGLPGSAVFTKTAGQTVSGHRVIKLDAAGKVVYASNTTASDAFAVFGITTQAASLDTEVAIASTGDITELSWSWTPGLPVFLGVDGILTQVPPESPAVFQLVIALAVDSNTLVLTKQPPLFII